MISDGELRLRGHLFPVCLDYQPSASGTFLTEQISIIQPDNDIFLAE
jgi:hypothetical protein